MWCDGGDMSLKNAEFIRGKAQSLGDGVCPGLQEAGSTAVGPKVY